MEQFWNHVWKKAKEIYGEKLPEIVEERLKEEERVIRQWKHENDFSIAEKIVSYVREQHGKTAVWGRAGNSFVSFLLGITYNNPLPAHYFCPKCKKFHLAQERNIDGFDLPSKKCEECGTALYGDGHNLRYEFLLGENGEKTPDFNIFIPIDLYDKIHTDIEDIEKGNGKEWNGAVGASKYMRMKEISLCEVLLKNEISTEGIDSNTPFSTYVNLFGKEHRTTKSPISFNFRDDVFDILVNFGMDEKNAFHFADYVGLGKAIKGIPNEKIDLLHKFNIPENIIEEIKQVEYLFPKAHAIEVIISECSIYNCRRR